MKIKDIVQAVERLAPPSMAAPWDNPGLLLGDAQAECSRIIVALDLTQSVLEQAAAANCQLILTHHPFIFNGQKQVLAGSYEGDLILALAKHNIAVMAAHTNWDNAEDGINWALAEALELQEIEPILDPNYTASEILLLAGNLPKQLAAAEFLAHVSACLQQPTLRAAGLQQGKMYQRVAVLGGAGMDLWPQAQAAGCDVLISSDGKHHIGLQAAHNGFALIDATHFSTEIIGIRQLSFKLADVLPELQVFYAEEHDAWAFYEETGEKL